MTKHILMATALGLAALAGASMPAVAPAQSFSRDEQNNARRAMLDGQVMPFSVIKRRIEREMQGEAAYVGVAPSPREGVYRMQFMRNDGVVIWVDVDGKTGNIIARTR